MRFEQTVLRARPQPRQLAQRAIAGYHERRLGLTARDRQPMRAQRLEQRTRTLVRQRIILALHTWLITSARTPPPFAWLALAAFRQEHARRRPPLHHSPSRIRDHDERMLVRAEDHPARS